MSYADSHAFLEALPRHPVSTVSTYIQEFLAGVIREFNWS